MVWNLLERLLGLPEVEPAALDGVRLFGDNLVAE